jgi:hypothetical protein
MARERRPAIPLGELEHLEVDVPTMKAALPVEEPEKLIGEPLKRGKAKHITAPVEQPEVEAVVEISLVDAEPDELRRAILHYEILGKPMSLREPLQ